MFHSCRVFRNIAAPLADTRLEGRACAIDVVTVYS